MLLDASNVLGNVVNRNGVLNRQTVRLRFQTGLVDEDSGIGVEASEGEADMGIEELDLGGRDAGVLELHG